MCKLIYTYKYHSLGGGLHLLTNANAVPTHHHFAATGPVATNTSLTSAMFAHNLEGKHKHNL